MRVERDGDAWCGAIVWCGSMLDVRRERDDVACDGIDSGLVIVDPKNRRSSPTCQIQHADACPRNAGVPVPTMVAAVVMHDGPRVE